MKAAAWRPSVLRFVDHAHATGADLSEDAVMGNRLTHGLKWRSYWLDMVGVDEGKAKP